MNKLLHAVTAPGPRPLLDPVRSPANLVVKDLALIHPALAGVRVTVALSHRPPVLGPVSRMTAGELATHVQSGATALGAAGHDRHRLAQAIANTVAQTGLAARLEVRVTGGDGLEAVARFGIESGPLAA